MLASVAPFLAYLSGVIYSKTGVPDIIWLLGFGILMGPGLGLVDASTVSPLSPLLSLMALSLLMFEVGLNIDVPTFMETMYKSAVLGIITFTISTLTLGYGIHLIRPNLFSLSQGMLFGSMLGGTSIFTVLGMLGSLERYIENMRGTRVLLVLESVFNDALCIVSSMTLMRMIMNPGVSLSEGFRDVLFVFIMASIIGLLIGLIWAQVLDILRNRAFNYMITIAALFMVYIISDVIGGRGAGPMAALIFGFTINNYHYFRSFLGRKSVRVERRRLRSFYEELTFLIKSIFFVFIGLQIVLSLEYYSMAVIVSLGLLAARITSINLANIFSDYDRVEKVVSLFVFSNGFTALLISQLPVIFDPLGRFFSDTSIYTNVCVPIVILSVLFGSIVGPPVSNILLKQDEGKNDS